MAVAYGLRAAERRRAGMRPGLMQAAQVERQPSGKAASHRPQSDSVETGVLSLQELVEFQREFYERTIPLWNAMLERMGTSPPMRADD